MGSKPRAAFVGLAFLPAFAVAGAPDPVYVTDSSQMRLGRMSAESLREHRNHADKYALASHLAVLKDGDQDEVRFWVTWATFDPATNGIGTVAYVVTDRRSRTCRISYSRKSTVPKSGLCRQYSPHEKRKRIVEDLVRLSALADVAIDCQLLDGAWVLIDAVSNGKRFVLYANNPQSCGGDGAKLVSELLNEVEEPSS
jgi:hypothetical protein